MRKQGSCLEKGNAGNNARCTKARKATHGLDGQHQDVDRTLRGRVSQNDRGQRKMEKVRPWCGQPSDRGRLKNGTELIYILALEMSRPVNQHCASCIGTLSFPVALICARDHMRVCVIRAD